MNQHGSLQFLPNFDANNRINDATHYTYDASGNLTYANDGVTAHSFAFDAENRIANIDSSATTYLYDGNGKRVRKTTGSNYTEYVFFGGAAIAEKDQSGNFTDYILAGGKRVAMATGSSASGTTYYHGDFLGSNRLMTDSTGTYVAGTDRTYLPFGSEWNYSSAVTHYKFTGDEHDSESNTEHTDFRQLSATQGRWLSPDPYMGSMDVSNPQTLNRYGYVANNPIGNIDTSGLFQCATPGEGDKSHLWCGGGGLSGSSGAGDLWSGGGCVVDGVNSGMCGTGDQAQCPRNDCTGVSATLMGLYRTSPVPVGTIGASCYGTWLDPTETCEIKGWITRYIGTSDQPLFPYAAHAIIFTGVTCTNRCPTGVPVHTMSAPPPPLPPFQIDSQTADDLCRELSDGPSTLGLPGMGNDAEDGVTTTMSSNGYRSTFNVTHPETMDPATNGVGMVGNIMDCRRSLTGRWVR